jgi:hypothetical protein
MIAAAERQDLQVVDETYSQSHIVAAPKSGGTTMNTMAMIAGALERGATAEMIDKLFEWQERLEQKDAARAFDAAFASAKAKFHRVLKDAHVSFESRRGGASTDYTHETLAGIGEAVDDALHAQGLAYSWEPKQIEGGRVEVTCVLSHVSGHSRRATLSGSPDQSGNKNNLQAVASTVSYLERYTLKAVLGIASKHDDDGMGGAQHDYNPDPGRTPQPRPEKPAPKPDAPKITAAQAADLKIKLQQAKDRGADEPAFWVFAQATKVEDVAADRYPTIMSALKSRYGVK